MLSVPLLLLLEETVLSDSDEKVSEGPVQTDYRRLPNISTTSL